MIKINERGSIPLALIVAITSLVTVLMLGTLILTENIANRNTNSKYENEIYYMKNAMEATVNVVLQKLDEDETKYENHTIHTITPSELQEIQNALNTSVLPYVINNGTVALSNIKYNKSLDMLCEEAIGLNPQTYQREVTGIHCDKTYFYMSFDLSLTTNKGTEKMNVKFDNLYPYESNVTGYVKVNYDNLKVDFSGL